LKIKFFASAQAIPEAIRYNDPRDGVFTLLE
jgi:hypothetical protein